MRILCFGDSNTYGFDPRSYLGDRYSAEDRWADILAKQTGWEILNAGANGREIPRNPYALRLLSGHASVDIFLVMLGTNDLLQGASALEAATQMEAFLNQLLTSCKTILLVAPPPMKRGAWVSTDELVKESSRLAEEYRLLAQKLHIPFADTRGWKIELAFDGVHFTESGHRTFAANIASEIKKSFSHCPIMTSEQSK
ncbi:MAG: GDSL-type esterase/lipase family protein [Faecousia sp.]